MTRQGDVIKPLPGEAPIASSANQPLFGDAPIVSQELPEQPAFVDAYRKVGAPRILVLVNRAIETGVVPQPQASQNRQNEPVSLPPRNPDYQAVEAAMTEWLSCGGQVTVLSSALARQQLTEQQIRDIQEGRPRALLDAVQQSGADIFVHVQAHPTQSGEMRVIGEAMNVRGGESIARGVVDLVPPLDKPTINRNARFLTRKLMDGMLLTWSAPRPATQPR